MVESKPENREDFIYLKPNMWLRYSGPNSSYFSCYILVVGSVVKLSCHTEDSPVDIFIWRQGVLERNIFPGRVSKNEWEELPYE